MPPFSSTSKAVGSLISRRSNINNHLLHYAANGAPSRKLLPGFRCFSGIAGIETPLVRKLIGQQDVGCSSSRTISDVNNLQRRQWFLGCGDGEEGSVLSKVYEEKRVIGCFFIQRISLYLFNPVWFLDIFVM